MCLFCNRSDLKLIYEDDLVYGILDSYPVSKGHALIITKRHIDNYFDTTEEEQVAINNAIMKLKKMLDELYSPDGYNIGINNGAAAGQTIMHLHIHLIPRYNGDMDDPKGGVRGVIPSKQKY